ncbi:AraC family transcriptional regulator [Catenovulum sp. SM1970]|uniref:AraC family transcriptional regulator n=1 Tax=Marinifaba aquimaris TaxID=2741323 RepID=UPI001572E0A9|nr:helix-turn-helix domain-containing protein [Marinifaba aquimaris]NTS78251.1 AraC family transcriptional regulator [Marinifaba aquimaris]
MNLILSPDYILTVLILNCCAILVLLAKKNRLNNAFLIGFLAAHIPLFVFSYLHASAHYPSYFPFIVKLLFICMFLYGPCIYLWAKENFTPSKSAKALLANYALHAIPAAAVLIALTIDPKLDLYSFFAFKLIAKLHPLFYLAASFYLLWNKQHVLMSEYADWPARRILLPLCCISLFCFFIVLDVVIILGFLVQEAYALSFLILIRGLINLGLAVGIIFGPSISVRLNRQKAHLAPSVSDTPTLTDDKNQETKRTSPAVAQAVSEQLKTLMEQEQLYLDADLTMQSLAAKLDINVYVLSEAINTIDGMNYYQYINQYRVAHAKKLLKENTELSIKSICFESGFNNRTSFNNAFKHIIGLTPSQYQSNPK